MIRKVQIDLIKRMIQISRSLISEGIKDHTKRLQLTRIVGICDHMKVNGATQKRIWLDTKESCQKINSFQPSHGLMDRNRTILSIRLILALMRKSYKIQNTITNKAKLSLLCRIIVQIFHLTMKTMKAKKKNWKAFSKIVVATF